MRLAGEDPRPAVLYLARPCQFLLPAQRDGCASKFWTSDRYGPQVELALADAIEQQRRQLGAHRIHLVGHSGGGALAARLAVQLPAVASLVTIAAPLDVRAWTDYHRVSPLTVVTDGAEFAARLAHLPQWHFAGSDDRVVPADLVRNFARLVGAQARFQVVAGERHDCCWSARWAGLLTPILTTLQQKATPP